MQANDASQRNIVDCYVGRRLKDVRKQKHVSQKKLAERLGVTYQQIQKYENGLNRLPSSRMLAICISLEITPNDFFMDLLDEVYAAGNFAGRPCGQIDLIETLRRLTNRLKEARLSA